MNLHLKNIITHKLRDLDAYPKINEYFYNTTFALGVVTIVSAIIMFFLSSSLSTLWGDRQFTTSQLGSDQMGAFLAALRDDYSYKSILAPRRYLEKTSYVVKETTLVVDTTRGGTLRINKFLAQIDAEDVSGERHFDIRQDIAKTRVDAHGSIIEARQDGTGAPKIEKPLQKHGSRLEHNETYRGSCYGAEMCAFEGHGLMAVPMAMVLLSFCLLWAPVLIALIEHSPSAK